MVKMDFDYRRKNGLILYHLPVVSRAEPEEFSLNAEPERVHRSRNGQQPRQERNRMKRLNREDGGKLSAFVLNCMRFFHLPVVLQSRNSSISTEQERNSRAGTTVEQQRRRKPAIKVNFFFKKKGNFSVNAQPTMLCTSFAKHVLTGAPCA